MRDGGGRGGRWGEDRWDGDGGGRGGWGWGTTRLGRGNGQVRAGELPQAEMEAREGRWGKGSFATELQKRTTGAADWMTSTREMTSSYLLQSTQTAKVEELIVAGCGK